MNDRIDFVDAMKGITIFLVVVGHAFQGMVSMLKATQYGDYSSVWYATEVIYSFHMPLFFLIAGLFVRKNNRLSVIFFIKKLKRIAVPYFVWGGIMAIIMQIASNYTNGGLGLKNFLLSPFIPFSQYWFLYVLFFIQLAYGIFSKFASNEYSRLIFLIVSILLITIHNFVPDVWIFKQFSAYSFYFALGMYALPYLKKIYSKVRFNSIIMLLLLLIWLILALLKLYYFSMENYLLNIILAVIGIIVFSVLGLWLTQTRLYMKNIVEFWGMKSMEIYCMHLIPLAGMRIFLFKILHLNSVWPNLLIMIVFSMMILHLFLKYSSYQKTFITYSFGNNKEA